MQPCLDRFAFFSVFNKNSGFEWNTNPSLWYQINRIILGQICVYQLGNWWNPYIRKIFKIHFCCHLYYLLKSCLSIFLGIIYKMYVTIDDFVYLNHFCYVNQIPSMLGFIYFIIYYITPHVLWKRIISYLCYLDMPSITQFLNSVNMLVTVNCAYV